MRDEPRDDERTIQRWRDARDGLKAVWPSGMDAAPLLAVELAGDLLLAALVRRP